MNRQDELKELFKDVDESVKTVAFPLIEEMVFVEDKIKELKKMPFIVFNPKNNAQQKTTPAGKQYKELLQQYLNCVKLLDGLLRKHEVEEESPLRAFFKNIQDKK